MDELAATYYLVERIESDLLTSNRRMAWRTAGGLARGTPLMMPPMPDPNRPLVMSEAETDEIRRNTQGDMVRILDREGNVVWWREFRSREASLKKHAEIMDDLMTLDGGAFRQKYGIIPERPLDIESPHADQRSEGGFGWRPSADAGGPREGDISWDDPAQR